MAFDPTALARPQIPAAFRRLSWAILLLFLDFRLGLNGWNFDIVPDIVGWALSISAAGRLRPLHTGARPLELASWIGAVLALPSVFTWGSGFPGQPILPDPILAYPLAWAEGLVWVVYIWLMMGIVSDLGQFFRRADLSARAHGVRLATAVLTIGSMLLALPSQLGVVQLPGPLIVLAAVLGFVVAVVLTVVTVRLLRKLASLIDDWRRALRAHPV